MQSAQARQLTFCLDSGHNKERPPGRMALDIDCRTFPETHADSDQSLMIEADSLDQRAHDL